MSNQKDTERDADLLARMREGDSMAFKKLYQRYWRYCYLQVYRRSGDQLLAEDITQSVFVTLWEKRTSTTISNLPAFLYSATRFKFVNHVKAQVQREKYMIHAVSRGRTATTASDTLVRTKELASAIDKGIAMMAPKTRTVYTLSRTENYSIKEIAHKLNLSEKAVEYHITQSLKTMRLALRDFF